jgi:hypothetical protein
MKEHHGHHHGHKKHGHHPHDHMAAVPQFKEGHWEKKMTDVSVADGKYGSEMNQAEEYKHSVDSLAAYAKKHKEPH